MVVERDKHDARVATIDGADMNARFASPLVGFNNNVRYRGVRFHIQTEDSGAGRPRINTHLFADGGRVIKTMRVDYSEHLAQPDYRAIVQRLMRAQHEAMARELRKGALDALIEDLVPPPPARQRSLRPPEPVVPSEPSPRVLGVLPDSLDEVILGYLSGARG